MKFVCDNCQAKYQIGDDKVAGKTVRMKCRKCGFAIKVTPTGADASGAAPVDVIGAPVSHGDAPPSSMLAMEVEMAAPSLAPASLAAAAPRAPMISQPGVRPAPHPAPGAPRPTTPSVHAALGLRPGAPAPAPQARPAAPPAPGARPAPAAPGRAPAPAPRPVTSMAGAPSAHAAAPRSAPQPAPAQTRSAWGADDEATSIMQSPSQDAVRAAIATATATAQEPASGGREVDWYVGIAGTPVGPIRTADIRARALAGQIDGESLAWREGLVEWRPVRDLPDLLEVVRAAIASRTPAPPAAPVSAPEPARAPDPPPAKEPTPAPAPLAAAAAANGASAALFQAPSAAPAPAHVLGDPFAAPAPQPAHAPEPAPANGKSNGFHRAEGGAALLAVPHDAPPAAEPRHAPDADANKPSADELEVALGRRKTGTHPMAYAFIAAAAVFGGVAAYALLYKPQTKIVVVHDAPTNVPTASAAPSAAPGADKGDVEVGDPSPAQPSGPVAKLGGPLHPKGPASATTSAPLDTSGFMNNVPGPAATAPSGGSGASAAPLSQGEVQGVVSQNTALVRRKCWQPALEARAQNGPTTVKITGSITVSGSGAVSDASASGGEKDFPGLSSCIAASMKRWKFPPSGGSSTFNVPFVFAGQ
jgi:predicted Zn finger-like uncharacterized protein